MAATRAKCWWCERVLARGQGDRYRLCVRESDYRVRMHKKCVVELGYRCEHCKALNAGKRRRD